jgi:ankyrin repeat protein
MPSLISFVFNVKMQTIGGNSSGISKNEISSVLMKIENVNYPLRTQLHWQALAGNSKMVVALVRKGEIPVDARDDENKTALHLAAQYSHIQTVKALIDLKADVHALTMGTLNALDLVEQNDSHWKLSSRLWEHNAVKEVLKQAGCNRWTPLMLAAEKGDVAQVEQLLSRKANPNEKYRFEGTALHFAKTKLVVQSLVNAKAEINAEDNMSQTPMHTAASRGNAEVVTALIQNKATIDAVDCQCSRPIDKARYLIFRIPPGPHCQNN